MKSMRKMQALKPQIDAINAKYKGMSVRDPKKADQTQETMALYKKHGVNPMGGCLPMVLQLPILFAFYEVFRACRSKCAARIGSGSPIFRRPRRFRFTFSRIIMIATQFLIAEDDAAARRTRRSSACMMFMPLIFGFMFYNLPSGLVLYYLTSNLVGVGLQWFFNKTDTARLAAAIRGAAAEEKIGEEIALD